MKVTCKVKSVDTRKLVAKSARVSRAVRVAVTEAARMDTLPYVPRVTGNLARTADTQSKPERGLLVYGGTVEVPYARAQYYGMPDKTRSAHPRATMLWFEISKAANGRAWERLARQIAKEVT